MGTPTHQVSFRAVRLKTYCSKNANVQMCMVPVNSQYVMYQNMVILYSERMTGHKRCLVPDIHFLKCRMHTKYCSCMSCSIWQNCTKIYIYWVYSVFVHLARPKFSLNGPLVKYMPPPPRDWNKTLRFSHKPVKPIQRLLILHPELTWMLEIFFLFHKSLHSGWSVKWNFESAGFWLATML